MRRYPIIKKLSAGFLILLFAFCVTPKKIWHDLVAHHQDTSISNGPQSQFLHAGYHCHFEDLVVNAPFLAEASSLSIPPVSFAVSFRANRIISLHIKALISRQHRGPPVSMLTIG